MHMHRGVTWPDRLRRHFLDSAFGLVRMQIQTWSLLIVAAKVAVMSTAMKSEKYA